MTIELIKYIFLFLLGCSLLNFGIAVLIRFKTKNKAFNDLLLYWPAIILTYVAAAILSQGPTQIATAYFFQIISSNLIVKMMCSAQGIPFRWKRYVGFQLSTMLLAIILLTQTQTSFTAAVLPVSIAFALPFISPIWHSLVSNRKESSWIEKTMGLVFITGMINHLNYALFRMNPNAAFWGWSVSIAQYQCLSLFLPLLINYRREENEKKHLKQAIERLSGRFFQSSQTEELYSQLEYQISEKERFSADLSKTNSELLNEQEMNEILIRTISHDLANPLSALKLSLTRLKTKKLNDEESEKTLTLLDRSTDSAISMITNIRNALITKSQLELTQISHFSIERSINKLLLEFESRLAQKSLVLKIENKLQDEGMAKGNEEAIIQHVFANILSNAIKFSQPHSMIVITIDGNQDYILTSFKDTGIGFMKTKAKTHQSQLGTSGEKGSGFGLMITGYFVRQFGGDFSIESEKHGESHGTTVTIKLLKAKATLVKTFDFSNKDANFLSKIL